MSSKIDSGGASLLRRRLPGLLSQAESNINVIPCQINAKNGQPPQISKKLGLQVEPHDLLAHTKFWPQELCGFYFTALRNLYFLCIFAVPDHTKQTVFSFLLHLRRHFLYKSVAYEEFSYVVEQD